MKYLINKVVVRHHNFYKLYDSNDNNAIYWFTVLNDQSFRLNVVDSVLIESKEIDRELVHLHLQNGDVVDPNVISNDRKIFKKLLEKKLIEHAKVFLTENDNIFKGGSDHE
jgi:hypothetical protein